MRIKMSTLILSSIRVCMNSFDDWDEENEPPPCRDKDCSECPYNYIMVVPKFIKEDK